MNSLITCLYDGFKIRIYDSTYVQEMLVRAGEFGIEHKYNRNRERIFPVMGNFLGCSRTKENRNSSGFQVTFLQENKYGRNILCFEISGSFHKFSNNWEHNANTFTYKKFIEALDKIKKIFQLNNLDIRVCNLEIGKNFIIPSYFNQSSKSLTDYCVFAKSTSKNENRTNKNRSENGQSLYFDNETTKSKIYAKSYQQKSYSDGAEIIRIEAVIRKSRAIHKSLGIYKYEDLYEFGFHEKATSYFQKRFKNIIFYQPAIEKLVSSKEERDLLLDFIKPDYWTSIYKGNKIEFQKKRNYYFSILTNNNIPNISTFIVDQISSINTNNTV